MKQMVSISAENHSWAGTWMGDSELRSTYALGRDVPLVGGALDTVPVVLVTLVVSRVVLGLGHCL